MTGARSEGLHRQRVRVAWGFLIPGLTVLAVVGAWPLARTIWVSFTDAILGDSGAAQFVGWTNYRLLLSDPAWWASVGNTVIFAASSVVLETALGLVFALILNAGLKGGAVLRAAVLVPWAVPLVVSGKMWTWMYHDLYGVVNAVLIDLGFLSEGIAWLAEPGLALGAIIFTDVWKTTPFMAMLLLAGLQMIPRDLYEAARLDGVSALGVFFRVTLPLLMPVLLVAVIFRTLDALRIFDLVYVMTSNSPATATVSVFARQQLVDFAEVGYGSAASVLIFVMIALFTVAYVTAGRRHFQ
jgi:trehalose/maltose transport system permease protein